MVRQKGAFQLSLGFIITVIFAVVLLTLSLTWLQGILLNIGGLTDDLTANAREKITEGFRGKEHKFGIYPTSYSLAPGRSLKMAAGIENSARDTKNHHFVINVVPVSADNFVLSSACNGEFCDELQKEMDKWVTHQFKTFPSPELVKRNEYRSFIIEVKPENAVKGTYIYNVYACYNGEGSDTAGDVPGYDRCSSSGLTTSEDQDKLWGSSQSLRIIVE